MREADFLDQLLHLLQSPVEGMGVDDKAALVREVCEETQRADELCRPVTCEIVPFTTGRRPTDEAAHPGLGSSDNASMLLAPHWEGENATYILYTLGGLSEYSPEMLQELRIDVTLSFCGTDGSQATRAIPGWNRRPITPAVFDLSATSAPMLQEISLADAADRRLVLKLAPNEVFLPGSTWKWEDIDPQVESSATDGNDPFTFGHMFTQMLLVHLRVTRRNTPIASASTSIDICDTRRFGSLYQRILDLLIAPDAEAQGKKAGVDGVDHRYHPWSPVLLIGSEKAALYTHGLIEDIVYKKRHLTDPRWLMRVGLYLELLTCIGVFEAVKGEVGDLLTKREREEYERSPFFKEIRRRLNIQGWKEVWRYKEIAFPKFGSPHTGPVAAVNLLQKRKAVLAFLHVHHQDLKQAIDLAGPNTHNSQETWGRVFRDAERAVLRKTPLAFPELSHLNPLVKDLILWHRQGKLGFFNLQWFPKQFEELFGDQDGLFAAACNQYRSSMNEVADWAKKRGLMDYTGGECVPLVVSLLHSHMEGRTENLERLQRRDGYTNQVDIQAVLPKHEKLAREDDRVAHLEERSVLPEYLFAEVPIFRILSDEERLDLAKTSRMISLGPYERIIIQGQQGSSLFLVAEGRLEVLVRQADETDHVVNVLKRGDAVGETSLLTGQPRSATVRAIDGAVVYEVGKSQFEAIVRKRPELVAKLSAIMGQNLRDSEKFREQYENASKGKERNKGVRRFFSSNWSK